jgi:hypothetical protein
VPKLAATVEMISVFPLPEAKLPKGLANKIVVKARRAKLPSGQKIENQK